MAAGTIASAIQELERASGASVNHQIRNKVNGKTLTPIAEPQAVQFSAADFADTMFEQVTAEGNGIVDVPGVAFGPVRCRVSSELLSCTVSKKRQRLWK